MPVELDCIHERLLKVENRIEVHIETLHEHDKRIADLQESLHENTALTRQIADNTGELIQLFKGAKAFKKFILWASPLIVMAYSTYQWIVGSK